MNIGDGRKLYIPLYGQTKIRVILFGDKQDIIYSN